MKTSRIALASFALAVLLAACSSTKGGVVTEKMHAEPEPEVTADASPDAAVPPAPKKDAAPPAPEPTGECGAETTQTGCVQCCSTKHEDGAATYGIALIECSCLAANCLKECAATICDENNPKNPDAACNTCIANKSASCAGAIKAACTPDPDCVAFETCVGQSSCTAKSN